MIEQQCVSESFDGTKIPGTLRLPAQPLGKALLVHGITSDREEDGFFTGLASVLASVGIASLRIDYRSHGQLQPMGMMALSLGGILSDIDCAYKCLERLAPGVPGYVFGVSFGGGVTAAWACTTEHKIDKVFLFAPVIDYVEDLENCCGDLRSQLEKHSFVNYNGHKLSRAIVNEARWLNVRKCYESRSIETIIAHGQDDNDVSIESSRRFARDIPNASLIELPNADHGFVVPGDFDAETEETKANYARVYSELLRHLP